MPKNSYIRILLLFGMALVFTINGCVDTSVESIPSTIDYQSSIKVVNFAEGVSSANFNMTTPDGITIALGTIAFGNEDHAGSAFMDVPAGAKTLTFNSESLKLNTDVDKKMRIFVYGDAANRDFTKFTQRYIFQTTDDTTIFKSGKGAFAFINGSSDAVVTGLNAISGSDTTSVELSSSLESGDLLGYTYLDAGTYTLNVLAEGSAGDSVIASIQLSLGDKGRKTAAIYNQLSSLQNKVFTDD